MNSLRLLMESVKTNGELTVCESCGGHTFVLDDVGWNPVPCPSCEGTGLVRDVEEASACTGLCGGRNTTPARPREGQATYVCTSVDGVIETGADLSGLLLQLLEDWPRLENGEQLCLWRDFFDLGGGEKDGPRVVAVLRAGPSGKTEVTWL
jgi:hypothetical protein